MDAADIATPLRGRRPSSETPRMSRSSRDSAGDFATPSTRRRRSMLKQARSVTSSWRGVAMAWQQQHAPLTDYAKLVRSSVSEVSPEERTSFA